MHIANSAICILDIRDVPSGDVSVTVSTKFFGKKTGKDQNSASCTKKNILFLVSTRNDNISRGCATKTEFPEGRGVRFGSQFLENPEGRGGLRKNPFHGGGMDIFWNYTMLARRHVLLLKFSFLAELECFS